MAHCVQPSNRRYVGQRSISKSRRQAGSIRRRLNCEPLESRSLLAISSLVAGFALTVISNAGDSVAISCSGGNVKINDADPDSGAAGCASLVSIAVEGGPGANVIDLSSVAAAEFAQLGSISALGRDGNDTIIGSPFGDVLDGGAGNDSIRGQGGNDILIGGPGNDTLDGQGGVDSANFSAAPRRVRVSLKVGLASGEGIDPLIGVENVIGSAFDDRIVGNQLANHLVGGLGSDRLKGGSGNDTLDGGLGDDSLIGGSGDDTLLGAEDNDRLLGQAGRDLLVGGLGADTLGGGLDDDILIAAYSDHDSDLDALAAIMAEWASVRSYSVRVDNLRDGSGSVDRVNGTVFLSAGDTVEEDSAADVMGGGAGLDWFFARLADPAIDSLADRSIVERLEVL